MIKRKTANDQIVNLDMGGKAFQEAAFPGLVRESLEVARMVELGVGCLCTGGGGCRV
jgi:hypothetical protein